MQERPEQRNARSDTNANEESTANRHPKVESSVTNAAQSMVTLMSIHKRNVNEEGKRPGVKPLRGMGTPTQPCQIAKRRTPDRLRLDRIYPD